MTSKGIRIFTGKICVAVLLVMGTGCAGIRPVLKPEQVALVNQTDVQSYLPQTEVNAQYIQSGYGAGGGLIGAIVDISVNAGRSRSANERVQNLREQVRDVDFRALYWEAISNEVCQTPWLKVAQFQPMAVNVERVTKSTVSMLVPSGA